MERFNALVENTISLENAQYKGLTMNLKSFVIIISSALSFSALSNESIEQATDALENAHSQYLLKEISVEDLIDLERSTAINHYMKKGGNVRTLNPLLHADCAVAHQTLGDKFYSNAHATLGSLTAMRHDFDLFHAVSIAELKYKNTKFTDEDKKKIAQSVIHHRQCFLII